MLKRGLMAAGLVVFALLSNACSNQKAEQAFPYYCNCSCVRCIERNPSTGECVSSGRQAFTTATCATEGDTMAACTGICDRFGTDCHVEVGGRAMETACNGASQ
jgi:hypothetical protein